MGLGITKDGPMTVYTVPLIGGQGDDGWTDNTWVTEHLRQLASKIEESNFNIISIGTITTNCTGAIPELVVKGFENYVEAYYETKDTPLRLIRAVDFDKLGSRKKWDIWDKILNVDWVCNHCKNEDPEFKVAVQGAGMDVIECPWCSNILTHRTNGGQSNPFEWTFINKKK